MLERVLDVAALCALWSIIPATGAFVVLYWLRSEWRINRQGRAIMYRTAAIFVVLLMGLIRYFLPDWPTWALVLRLVAYLVAAWAFWWMLYALLRTQHSDRHEHAGDPWAPPPS